MTPRLLLLWLAVTAVAWGGERDIERRLFVPFEHLHELMLQQQAHVLLDEEEFVALQAQARRTDEVAPPHAVWFSTAEYLLTVDDQMVMVEGAFTVGLADAALHQVPLDLVHVSLLEMTVDGRPAAVGRPRPLKTQRADASPFYLLFVQGKGDHQVRFTGRSPLRRDAQRAFRLHLPASTGATVRLQASGNVDFSSESSAVISRRYDEELASTFFELLVPGNVVEGALGHNHRETQEGVSLLARGVLHSRLEAGGEHLEAIIAYDVLYQPVEELTLSLPPDFHVTQVRGDGLNRWSVAQAGEMQQVTVQLQGPRTGSVTLGLTAWRNLDSLQGWRMPSVRPLDTESYSALIAVSAESTLELQTLEHQHLLPLSHQALPTSKLDEGARRLFVGYAPHAEYELQASLQLPEGKLGLHHRFSLQVSDEQLSITGNLRLIALEQPLFGFTMQLPDGWILTTIQQADGVVLTPETRLLEDGRQAVHLRLPKALMTDQQLELTYSAVQIPEGWFDAWQERTIMIPAIRFPAAEEIDGEVIAFPVGDLQLFPEEHEHLAPLSRSDSRPGVLSWKMSRDDFTGVLRVQRITPRVTARTETMLTIGREAIRVIATIEYSIEAASVREVKMLVPPGTPPDLNVRGTTVGVKEYIRTPGEDGDLWTLHLNSRATGSIAFVISYEMSMAAEAVERLELPIVQASDVSFQSGLVAVGAASDLDISVIEHPRKVDEGEVRHLPLESSERLLGTYSYVGAAPRLAVSVRHPEIAALPAAIVQKASLSVVLSESGLQQAAFEASLRSKVSYVHLALPPDATLWSVTVDGRASLPRQVGDAIRIETPPDADRDVRQLRVLYERRGKPLRAWRAISILAPAVLLQHDGQAYMVPSIDLEWQVSLPNDYRVVGARHAVPDPALPILESPLASVGRAAYQLSGGIDFEKGLLSSCMSVLSSTFVRKSEYSAEYGKVQLIIGEGADAVDDELERREAEGGKERKQAAPREKGSGSVKGWQAAGMRSLEISLQRSGNEQLFRHLGEATVLEVSLVNERWWRYLGWALGLASLVAGIAMVSRRHRNRYLIGLLLVAGLVPVIPGLAVTALALNRVFAFALLLAVCYLLIWLGRGLVGQTRAAFALTVTLALMPFIGTLQAAEESAPPLAIPKDALIVPYNPDDATESGKILVPREMLERLRRQAEAEVEPVPSQQYGLAGAEYALELGDEDTLTIVGKVHVQLFVDGPVGVDFHMRGLVITGIESGGRKAAPRLLADGQYRIHLTGKGLHTLDIQLLAQATRHGGARQIDVQLPGGAVAGLEVTMASEGMELQALSLSRPLTWRSSAAGEQVRLPTGEAGAVNLRWQPRTTHGQIDRTLTAESSGIFGVRLDRRELNWEVLLSFRGGPRAAFELLIPDGYRVQRVTGKDVRGWKMEEQRLHVETLAPVTATTSMTVMLWQAHHLQADEAMVMTVPAVEIPGAARHTGRLAVVRAPAVALQVVESSGLVRAKLAMESMPPLWKDVFEATLFEGFTFSTTPYTLSLQARQTPRRFTVEEQTLVRLSEELHEVETRLIVQVQEGTLSQLDISLPAAYDLRDLVVANLGPRLLQPVDDGQLLTLFFDRPQTGQVSVILRGKMPLPEPDTAVSLPVLEVAGAGRQTGHLVVQAPEAYEVVTARLQNLSSALPEQVASWMRAAQLRQVRAVFRYTTAPYAGSVTLRRRRPDVACISVTNVRITPAAIEETILLDFTIRQAGIDRVEFELPEHLAEARILVPHLRQKVVTPIAGSDRVLVMVELQQDVMGQLRILITENRGFTPGSHEASIPRILTGRTERRFVAIENASRDEVVVAPGDGFQPLSRQQRDWALVSQFVKGGNTQAFVVDPGIDPPNLVFEGQLRQAIETVGARIGMVRTILVVEEDGLYRGLQTYYVNNRTEAYLELELPANAELLTAQVAGKPVKPVRGGTSQRPRIPLVKTAIGDLDYEVVLMYGGRMGPLGALTSANMPLVHTRGINVEATQVELRLPANRRWWRFASNMSRKADELSYQVDFLDYQNRQAEELVQTLQFGNEYERSRAASNWQTLSTNVANVQQQAMVRQGQSAAAEAQMRQSQAILQKGQQALKDVQFQPQGTGAYTLTNSGGMAIHWSVQLNQEVAADLLALDYNFASPVKREERVGDGVDRAWLPSLPEQRPEPAEAIATEDDADGRYGDFAAAPAPATIPLAPAPDTAQVTVQPQQEISRQIDGVTWFSNAGTHGTVNGQAPAILGMTVDGQILNLPIEVTGYGAASPGHLASLEASLPAMDANRWDVFRFSTPRGGAQITAHGVAESWVNHARRILVVLLFLTVVWWIVNCIRQSATRDLNTAVLGKWLALGSLLALILGVLPVLAIPGLVAGIVLRLSSANRRRQHVAEPY